MTSINFETGKIDPRCGHFDHHGPIGHSNAFVCKMASVQLIESLVLNGELDNFAYDQVELNHCGHLDDICLHAIVPARDSGKLRSLYAFASRVSALDSLGPAAYTLMDDATTDLANKIYERYQELVGKFAEEAGCQRWQVPLDDQITASMEAGRLLAQNLPVDAYTPKPAWVPPEGSWHFDCLDRGILAIEAGEGCNPLRASSFFFREYPEARVLLAYRYNSEAKTFTYTACTRSAYSADLGGCWEELSEMETSVDAKWGGHSGAGGSPRKNGVWNGGSSLLPSQVLDIINRFVQ
jgi:hypothetical protein